MCEQSLLGILTACKRLRTFKFEIGDDFAARGQFDFNFLIDEIRTLHGASLESLSFSADTDSENERQIILDKLWNLVPVVRESFPALGNIVIRFHKHQDDDFGSLIGSYRGNDIRLKIE
jgi:hypothetical protein